MYFQYLELRTNYLLINVQAFWQSIIFINIYRNPEIRIYNKLIIGKKIPYERVTNLPLSILVENRNLLNWYTTYLLSSIIVVLLFSSILHY